MKSLLWLKGRPYQKGKLPAFFIWNGNKNVRLYLTTVFGLILNKPIFVV